MCWSKKITTCDWLTWIIPVCILIGNHQTLDNRIQAIQASCNQVEWLSHASFLLPVVLENIPILAMSNKIYHLPVFCSSQQPRLLKPSVVLKHPYIGYTDMHMICWPSSVEHIFPLLCSGSVPPVVWILFPGVAGGSRDYSGAHTEDWWSLCEGRLR